MLMFRCFFGLFGVLKLALMASASYMAYVLNATALPGWVTSLPGYYAASMGASIELWPRLCGAFIG
jgi:hypothetical protein